MSLAKQIIGETDTTDNLRRIARIGMTQKVLAAFRSHGWPVVIFDIAPFLSKLDDEHLLILAQNSWVIDSRKFPNADDTARAISGSLAEPLRTKLNFVMNNTLFRQHWKIEIDSAVVDMWLKGHKPGVYKKLNDTQS
jgi:hypothetical protein